MGFCCFRKGQLHFTSCSVSVFGVTFDSALSCLHPDPKKSWKRLWNYIWNLFLTHSTTTTQVRVPINCCPDHSTGLLTGCSFLLSVLSILQAWTEVMFLLSVLCQVKQLLQWLSTSLKAKAKVLRIESLDFPDFFSACHPWISQPGHTCPWGLHWFSLSTQIVKVCLLFNSCKFLLKTLPIFVHSTYCQLMHIFQIHLQSASFSPSFYSHCNGYKFSESRIFGLFREAPGVW